MYYEDLATKMVNRMEHEAKPPVGLNSSTVLALLLSAVVYAILDVAEAIRNK